MRLPITKDRVRNHFHYAWWQYVLLVIVAVAGWNFLYTTTRYRSPENLKVEFYCEAAVDTQDLERIEALLESIRQTEMPDMEEVTYTSVGYDKTYGDMQLTVWMAAGQGDVYLLSNEKYQSTADSMMDLTPYVENGTLNVEGIDLTRGYSIHSETGERVLTGIPADSLTGLHDYNLVGEGYTLSILEANGNDENSLKLLNWFLTHLRGGNQQ